jgi:murein DD-endopeptidase MepM/ murein hydrolase activator NlpD
MVTIRGHFSLIQQRFARSSPVAARAAVGLDGNDVTQILPLDGFDFDNLEFLNVHDADPLVELEFGDDSPFGNGARVLLAPELDDLDETDDLTPLRLSPVRPASSTEVTVRIPVDPGDTHVLGDDQAFLDSLRDTDIIPRVRAGVHRKQPTSAARGRLLISAMAAGAAAAAGHLAAGHAEVPKTQAVLTASVSSPATDTVSNANRGAQVIAVPAAASAALHNQELAKGVAFANDRAQREARLQQPLYVMPTKGIFTSNFGYRWGVLHAGIDLANSIGTPIYAVSDGVVIDAGPTGGYGMWVKLRHADGTVTLYGHVNTTLVSTGQKVMAGDQIATMGNRGNSTGPHLHFEVLQGGTERIDPVPWLAKRGLTLGNYSG